MNRHQEACELIWKYLEEEKRYAMDRKQPEHYIWWALPIEKILILTESRIQDDLEDQFQSINKENRDASKSH